MIDQPIRDISDLWHEFLYRKNKGEKEIVINYKASHSEVQQLREREIKVDLEIKKLKDAVCFKII